MKKFRIVQTGEGFFIQYKIFFRWHNFEELYISHLSRNGWWQKLDYPSGVVKYNTLDEAKTSLSYIKGFPKKYKNHKICIAREYLENRFVYLDTDSLIGRYYRLASADLSDLMEKIDKREDEKFQAKLKSEQEKKDKKIVKVYSV